MEYTAFDCHKRYTWTVVEDGLGVILQTTATQQKIFYNVKKGVKEGVLKISQRI